MNRLKYLAIPPRSLPALAAVAIGLCLFAAATLTAADAKDSKPAAPKKTAKAKPTGAELYAMHCNRCHAERYATERTAAQWKTIMLHMRVRANLPASEAKAVLKYLQEDSGK